jgi:tetratricopeptide (TPR) repeat protein
MTLARELDPLSLVILKDTGEIYYFARQYDDAIAYFRKALEIDPEFVLAHSNLGLAYAQKGEFASAIAEFQVARQLQDNPEVLAELGCAYALSGRTRDAQEVLDDLKAISKRRYVRPDLYAFVYAALGRKDKALEWLEKGYHEGGILTGLKVDPRWDSLRGDARFLDLMKKVGLTS